MKRLIAKWLSRLMLPMLLLMLCACGTTDDTEIGDQTATDAASSVSETEDPAGIVQSITMEQLKNYVLVRPEEAGDDLVKACIELRTTLIDTLGVKLNLKSDLHSETVQALKIGEFEILLGDCDRDETRHFAADLKIRDYGYAMVGKKLVIYGGSEEATLRALQAFVQNVVKNTEGSRELFYDGNMIVINRATYEVESLTLQGEDITAYTIVYPYRNTTDKALAQALADQIAEKCGILPKVISDKEDPTGKEILIGTTNRTECALTSRTLTETTYLVGAEGTYICARGADGIGDYYAVYALIAALFGNVSAEHKVTLAAATIENVPMDETLKAMSFNLKVASVTAQRQESVRQTIMNYMPDTLGVQEASPTWMTYLKNNIGDIYDCVGLGRDGGSNGEHSAIFYRKDRFDLIETGTKWMSATPDVVSKFDESSLNRVFTYAILLEKRTDTKIMVINTHLEHTSAEARNLQIKVLMNFLKDYTDYPMVLTGDFNANSQSEVYSIITDMLADSSRIAQKAETHYTFHNYGSSSTYIDFVFVSQKNIAVSHYRVITEAYNGMLPSDHYALITEYNVLK